MSTGIYFFEGSADKDGKAITMKGRSDDAVKGPMEWRSVTRIIDDNNQIFEMHGTDNKGKEEKMEISYTRG